MASVTVAGVCIYHGENAQDIPDLRHVKGILFFGRGKVHCFTNSRKRKGAVSKRAVVIPDLVPEELASESQQEANDLWTSALKRKDLVPGITDNRIFGFVEKWDEHGLGIIKGEDGEEYGVRRRDVAPDEFNRAFLLIGELVTFRRQDRDARENNLLTAIAVLPTPRVKHSLSAPRDYRAEFVVVRYDEQRGTGRLSEISNPRGRWVLFDTRDIITEGKIGLGVRVWCGFYRLESIKKGFKAHSIEICKEEEKEKQK
jgi:hypothetical protein